MTNTKVALGQFYTAENPFRHEAFSDWAARAGLPGARVLEPFAGENSLIDHLQAMGQCNSFVSYDIAPSSKQVIRRDTLVAFPRGFSVCVTNPPWLAKNSATANKIAFPACDYDDLYKFALEKCLAGCAYVAALVPESFIKSGLFERRLLSFVSIREKLFTDTAHPVGLALFTPYATEDVNLWSGDVFIGTLAKVRALYPMPKKNGVSVVFNADNANVGLYALDNTKYPSIRFCPLSEIAHREAKATDRAVSRVFVDGKVNIENIEKWNAVLSEFRKRTKDIFMMAYRGLRADGMYRRRLDWKLARGIIHNA